MTINSERLQTIISEQLQPVAKKVDEEAYYAEGFLYTLGKEGFFSSDGKTEADYLLDEAQVVQEIAKVCMTTAFCCWCHLAALTYLRKSDNEFLKTTILPKFENGELLGATGLSNPMKFYAGLERLHLKAEKVEGGYIINGVLPAVSNLGENHYFGAIASLDDHEVMVLVSTEHSDVVLKEQIHFIGVNGSATYACRFTNAFIANDFVIAHDAAPFVDIIRPAFIYYQVPLGIGVIESSIEGIEKVKAKQNGCNEFLVTQGCTLQTTADELQQTLRDVTTSGLTLPAVVALRRQSVYDTLDAVQANMIHNGAAGYAEGSVPYRKLREAYFFANLTPTVRQLEKMTTKLASQTK